MTNEEALKYHRHNYQGFVETMRDGDEENNPYDIAFAKSIEALEKQIPKKPTNDGIRGVCPICHQPLPNVAHNNCMYCGQAIDWSKDD